jgi:hypothetical protein
MPDKMNHPSQTEPKKNLQEDGVTNPRDGRGPLRKSDDSSTRLPLHAHVPKPGRPH